MMPTKEDFKRDCCISDAFINVIDKITQLTQFTQWLPPEDCKEIKLRCGSTGPLFANVKCRFLGRYYETKAGFYFWIGYDCRKNEKQRFYISFYSENQAQADKIKKTLESLRKNYEAEYCVYDKNYWYNVFLDIHLFCLLQPTDEIVNEVEKRITKIIRKLSSVQTNRGCPKLDSIAIPKDITSIGDYAFYNCTELKNVTILQGITEIGSYAFSGCTGLKEITIEESNITEIKRCAFHNIHPEAKFKVKSDGNVKQQLIAYGIDASKIEEI